MTSAGQRGSSVATFMIVLLAMVVVLVVVVASFDRIRAYHDRSTQAMEIPL